MNGSWCRGIRVVATAGAIAIGGYGCSTVPKAIEEGSGGGGPQGPDSVINTAETVNLNIAVTASGTPPVADLVRRKVEGSLAQKSFNLDAKAPDVKVTLESSHKFIDTYAGRAIYEGTVDAAVIRVHDGQLLGRKIVPMRGERVFGEDNALRSLGDKLGVATAEWVTKTAQAGANDLVATDIKIRRPWRPFPGRDAASYATKFVEQVSRLEGVVTCRVIAQDRPDRTLVFRVVYYRREVSEGVLNRIANRLPDLGIAPQ